LVGFNPFLPRPRISEEYQEGVANYRSVATRLLKSRKSTTE
jgi:hypothetical protein